MSQVKNNVLNAYHDIFSNMDAVFRYRVCEECNFSIPTYYRKIRCKNKLDDKGRFIPALSNAEYDKICEIAEEVKNEFVRQLSSQKIKN